VGSVDALVVSALDTNKHSASSSKLSGLFLLLSKKEKDYFGDGLIPSLVVSFALLLRGTSTQIFHCCYGLHEAMSVKDILS